MHITYFNYYILMQTLVLINDITFMFYFLILRFSYNINWLFI